MSHLDPQRPASVRELRQFGLLVGGAFGVIAALMFWRHRPTAVVVPFAVLAASLVLAGATVPARLARVHAWWMGLALLLSKITTPIFMGVVYFIVLTPIGLLKGVFGGNRVTRSSDTGWRARAADDRRSVLARQF